jgi:hypothetical protein
VRKCIFDQRLKHQRRHPHGQQLRRHLEPDLQSVAEPDPHEFKVEFQKFQFLCQRDLLVPTRRIHRAPEEFAQV